MLGIFEKGDCETIDLQIKILSSPYVTGEIFLEYLRIVLIPTVESSRSLPGCKNKPAILFCDNCACRCSDEVKRESAEYGILLIRYPPHASHIFQVFGELKAAKKCLLRDVNQGRDLDHVMRIFHACELATTILAVQSSWQKAGFRFNRRDGVWYLYVNETKIRTSPEFMEVWPINYPEERLSSRRRQQAWRWLNQQCFRVKYRKALHL
jgi:hypothetical protein